MCASSNRQGARTDVNNSDRGDLADARRHLATGSRARRSPARRERALIEALSERYGPEAGTAKETVPETPICSSDDAGEGASARHRLCRADAHPLADAYPSSADILVLYARGRADRDPPNLVRQSPGSLTVGVVTTGSTRGRRHRPRAHRTQPFPDPRCRFEPAPRSAPAATADRLGLAPASPHLLHMPGTHLRAHRSLFPKRCACSTTTMAAQARQKASLVAQGFSQSVDYRSCRNRDFLSFAAR